MHLIGKYISSNNEAYPVELLITDAMLTEDSLFYMASEDEENVYLQLLTEE